MVVVGKLEGEEVEEVEERLMEYLSYCHFAFASFTTRSSTGTMFSWAKLKVRYKRSYHDRGALMKNPAVQQG